MKKGAKEDLDAYFAQADSWANDERENVVVSRKIAWIVAGVAIAIALLEAIALIVLTPLKTVQPYTLMVDQQTGFVQELKPIDPQLVSSEAALTQSFLVQYVLAREGFDINSLQDDYQKVALWSADAARRSYLASVPASNPSSHLANLPRATLINVRVKSVSTIGDQTSMVRFETTRQDAGGQQSQPRAWAAVMRYRFSGEPMSVKDRFVNPLGFQVVHYRRNEEVLMPDIATSQAEAITTIPEEIGVAAEEVSNDRPQRPETRQGSSESRAR